MGKFVLFEIAYEILKFFTEKNKTFKRLTNPKLWSSPQAKFIYYFYELYQ